MPVRNLIHLLLLGAALGLEIFAWSHCKSATDVPPTALGLHGAAALLAALLGASWVKQASLTTRATLGVLFFVLAGILPLGGVAVVGALAWIFSTRGADGLRPEDKYVFGNPEATAARKESRAKEPELRPLVESMRAMGVGELEQMIHGLRHLQPHRLTQFFLRRFQIDPNSNLQFAAQGVISSRIEALEVQLREISQRLTENPRNADARLAAAEVLIELAAWTPAGDTTAQVFLQQALDHLKEAQVVDTGDHRNYALQVEACLRLDRLDAAKVALTHYRNTKTNPEFALYLDLRRKFAEGDYSGLPAAVRALQDAPPEAAEALAFWTQPAPAKN